MSDHTQKPNPGKVSHGLGFALLAVVMAQLLLLPALAAWDYYFPQKVRDPYGLNQLMIWVSVGWTQLAYLIPLALFAHKRSKPETRNGILMVSAALFFATSLCYGAGGIFG